MSYTNSPLVVYTKLSPNHSGQRTHAIDRITPHCVVGQLTVESLGNIFAKSSYEASSNYGIGTDGKIALYVEERNRSWCSSSNTNDQRAVTIECASDDKHPYTMNDKVYSALIKLCVDICKRNGKTKLLWFADKNKALNYPPKSDEMILTVHRWFANKSCPGDWLYNRLGDLANKVTAQLSETKISEAVAQKEAKSEPKKEIDNIGQTNNKTNEEIIWDYLIGKGLNKYAVAGLMGNLYSESHLQPTNLQNVFETKLKMSDAEYTSAVDSGKYKNFAYDSAGYGLAQWTYYTRKQKLLNYAKSVNKSIGDLNMQLDFLWNELQGYTQLMRTLKNTNSIYDSSTAVLTQYEKPANQGTAVKQTRAKYGQEIFDRNTKKAETTKPEKSYALQVGAFGNIKNAQNKLATIMSKGFDGVIVEEGDLYKVRINFKDEDSAKTAMDKLKSYGITSVLIR